MKKTIIWILVIVVVGLIGYRVSVALKQKNKTVEVKEEGIPVEVTKPRIGDVAEKILLTGNVMPSEMVNAYAKVPGKLKKYLVEEGDMVTTDQVVAQINRDETGFDYAESPVKAPIGGMVSKKYIDVGTTVSPAAGSVAMATPIMAIVNIDKVKVIVDVVEKDIAKVRKDLSAKVKVDAYPKTAFAGKVTMVSPVVDPMSRTAKVEITVENVEHLLRPGMFANVDLLVNYYSDRILIPLQCVLEEKNVNKVFVVENDKAVSKSVTVGLIQENDIEIAGGLKLGDSVVSAGQHRLTDGTKVLVVTGGNK